MKTEIVKVNGSSIECPYENEQHYVAIKSICNALGIDHQKQFERIKSDPILKDAYTDTVYASDSTGTRKQKMLCIQLKYVFGWIFSIDDSKVNEKARPTFLKYKQECYNALYEHFYLKASLYEKRENIILNKKLEIMQLEKVNSETNEKIKQIKADIEHITSTPVNQLQLDLK